MLLIDGSSMPEITIYYTELQFIVHANLIKQELNKKISKGQSG
jgi:hypothetical protein